MSGTAFAATRHSFRVLLTGDYDGPSAPHRTLAKALAREGIEATFRPDLPRVSGHEWLREVRSANAVIHVEYGDPDPYSARQLAIATVLGRPVIRWWVGTDVLLCIRDPTLQQKAALVERIAAVSTVSASHLADELATVGLTAQFIPPPLDSPLLNIAIIPRVPRSVLVYLPTQRLDFYGADMVRALALLNPDLKFVIVADDSHSLRDLPNAASLGWVSDLDRLYSDTGCILRLTRHDAVPRMLVDGLLRGRYAIHSFPLEGCWLARTVEEAHEKLKLFRAVTVPNTEGAAAMARLYRQLPEARYKRLLELEMVRRRLTHRSSSLIIAGNLTVRGRLKKWRTRDG